ncbi:MAG: MBL fold metallo-hydrolase [Desulfobacterales bacterium]
MATTREDNREEIDPITVSQDLFLIPLDLTLPGFTTFLNAWLYKGARTFLIDVGPSASVPRLLASLDSLHVTRLDAILLTHIHLDHAGGIGEMAAAFPDIPILCHTAGIPHLIDPSRLWQGSLKTLGEVATAYGSIQPVSPDRLVDASHCPWKEVTPIITPGHSPHHVSYQIAPYLFMGETGGVHISFPSGQEYLRPATPPTFFLEIAIESIDALIALKPEAICYGHFGISLKGVEMLHTHRQQLLHWESVIADEINGFRGTDVVAACMERLLLEDPLLAGFYHLDETQRERERNFLKNSIKGFEGYLQQKGPTPA